MDGRQRGHGRQVLKFTQDGKFVAQYGKPGAESRQQRHGELRPAGEDLRRREGNEAYVADGYLNKRVAVIDADTGKFKRYWGAYGNKPDDTNLWARTTLMRH